MTLRFDSVIVGGGIAGLTAAYCMARAGLHVAVFERGDYPGAKNIIGGVLYTTVLEKLIPNFRSEAPLERPLTDRRFCILTPKSGAEFSFKEWNGDTRQRSSAFTILRAKFDQWLAGKAEDAGALIVPETVIEGFLTRDGRVVGVKAGRTEGDVVADVVVVADGANSLLAKAAGLIPKPQSSDYVLGVKQVIEIPQKVVEERLNIGEDEGVAVTYYGPALGKLASGYVYTNRESLSIGTAAYLHAHAERKITPFDLLDGLKNHSHVKRLIRGGKMSEYSAHLIPERTTTPPYADGLIVVGDAAGLLNPSPIFFEGTNLAMESARLAAEVVKKAKERGDFSTGTLSLYGNMLAESFVMKDLQRSRRIPSFLKKNPEIFTDYPERFTEALSELFKMDQLPKAQRIKLARRALTKKGGLPRLLWDLYRAWRAFS